ncbi:MAG: triose-phosphate isomerase [Bacteroidales bacterium]|jgi:triosephosphate isomerase|nr:triose-phosphate isomerase [Bacteroidales bacterium]
MELKPKILAGNWKMNTDLQEGMKLASTIDKWVNGCTADPHVRIILAVPFTHLAEITGLMDYRRVSVAAQNCAAFEKGAYTGEVSAAMIKSVGAHYCIIGHSERRHVFNEKNEALKAKVDLCLKHAVRPIFCCGETLDERKAGKQNEVIREQLETSFLHIAPEDLKRSIIAYEPVWAIGTGETASPEQAQQMHAFIRKLVAEKYENLNAQEIPILYGGSMKPDNAEDLLKQPDINGGLVGGASLKVESFIDILKAF